ncbi:hypothetical protein [Paraburkholderia sacchari]|uniref:hypothetical protein n=1 Tax=Paraburkholderia sacchari TaxID=159450 RepID=UPI001BCE244B|nr:hypothetical protein [Paraburkholderia sacchari]
MNRPYITVETILELFRSTADEPPGSLAPAGSLLWLADFLAREHATMNAGDWDALVHVGAQLWRAQAVPETWDGAPRMR